VNKLIWIFVTCALFASCALELAKGGDGGGIRGLKPLDSKGTTVSSDEQKDSVSQTQGTKTKSK